MNNNLFESLKNEVILYDKYINSLVSTYTRINDVYKGCQILYSPLHINPEILFIGINPGSGYYKSYGYPVKKYDPPSIFEYLDKNESYKLKNDTLDVFKKSQKTHLLNNAVKTNYMYFSTQGMKYLFELTTILCNHIGNEEPWEKANDWTNRLTDIPHPTIKNSELK